MIAFSYPASLQILGLVCVAFALGVFVGSSFRKPAQVLDFVSTTDAEPFCATINSETGFVRRWPPRADGQCYEEDMPK